MNTKIIKGRVWICIPDSESGGFMDYFEINNGNSYELGSILSNWTPGSALMFATGATDTEGNDVYADDVCLCNNGTLQGEKKCEGWVEVVKYQCIKERGYWEVGYPIFSDSCVKVIEVLGNIHQNPEFKKVLDGCRGHDIVVN